MGVSKYRGTPKSSILIGFSIMNHPFLGTPIFGNTHIPGGDRRISSINNISVYQNQVTLLRISAALHGIGRRHRQGAIAVLKARGHGVHASDLQSSWDDWFFNYFSPRHLTIKSVWVPFLKEIHEN